MCSLITLADRRHWLRTLFWAGDTFAPKVKVKDKNGEFVSIQKFLQDSYLAMSELLVQSVGDLDGVLGFEVRHVFAYMHTQTTRRIRIDVQRTT